MRALKVKQLGSFPRKHSSSPELLMTKNSLGNEVEGGRGISQEVISSLEA